MLQTLGAAYFELLFFFEALIIEPVPKQAAIVARMMPICANRFFGFKMLQVWAS